jgi:hypothetical protein
MFTLSTDRAARIDCASIAIVTVYRSGNTLPSDASLSSTGIKVDTWHGSVNTSLAFIARINSTGVFIITRYQNMFATFNRIAAISCAYI